MKHARADYDRFQDPAGKIPEDEPVFLLRGQDVFAPIVVRLYAQMARLFGQHIIADACEKQAKLMDNWQANIKHKVPDMPVPGNAGAVE